MSLNTISAHIVWVVSQDAVLHSSAEMLIGILHSSLVFQKHSFQGDLSASHPAICKCLKCNLLSITWSGYQGGGATKGAEYIFNMCFRDK